MQAGTTHEACLVNPVTGELKPLTIQLMSPIATGGQGSVRFCSTASLIDVQSNLSV